MSVPSLPHLHCSVSASIFVLRNCSVSKGHFGKNQHKAICQSQMWNCLALSHSSGPSLQAGGSLGSRPAKLLIPTNFRLVYYVRSISKKKKKTHIHTIFSLRQRDTKRPVAGGRWGFGGSVLYWPRRKGSGLVSGVKN